MEASDVAEWLSSDEGYAWSRAAHRQSVMVLAEMFSLSDFSTALGEANDGVPLPQYDPSGRPPL